MSILDYTTYSDIRASLGVSSDELPDATISLGLHQSNLMLELEEVDTNLVSLYSAAKAVATASQTADQRRLVESTGLFATYAVAKQLTASLAMFAPKEESDGKATLTRFALDPYKDVKANVLALYEQNRTRVVSALAKLQSSATTPVFFSFGVVSSPTSDPITGT